MRCTSLVTLAALLVPAAASAHIRITSPTPRSTTQLKQRHCGQAGSARANVQTYKPGATLHLVWDEYVAHPGWFRISFQKNGDTFEVPPPSNGPTGGGKPANYPTEDLTGKTDSATGAIILADRIQHPTLAMDVVLPNVECNNCTLQLTQMMTESNAYTDQPTSGNIYYACVDLVLSKGSAGTVDAGPGPTLDAGAELDAGTGGTDVDAAVPPPSGNDAGTGAGATGTSGGCTTTSAGSSSLVLLGLALIGLRRRRAAR
jgi:MYXO-CTERM domain-containing protein